MGRGEGRGRGETRREEAKRGEEEREARVGERLAGQHARRHKRGAASENGHVEGGVDGACGTCPRPVTAILPTTSAALCGAVEDARAAVDGAVLGLQPQQAVQLLPVPMRMHTRSRGEINARGGKPSCCCPHRRRSLRWLPCDLGDGSEKVHGKWRPRALREKLLFYIHLEV